MTYTLKETEKWLVGYEGRYFGNTGGQVFSLTRGKKTPRMLTPAVNNGRYMYNLYAADGCSDNHYAHRLIAETFIPNPKYLPYVKFIDDDCTNLSVDNLKWANREEMYGK